MNWVKHNRRSYNYRNHYWHSNDVHGDVIVNVDVRGGHRCERVERSVENRLHCDFFVMSVRYCFHYYSWRAHAYVDSDCPIVRI